MVTNDEDIQEGLCAGLGLRAGAMLAQMPPGELN